MADEFKFPDEEKVVEEELEVEIIDDTPAEDRNREPLVENPEPDEEELLRLLEPNAMLRLDYRRQAS